MTEWQIIFLIILSILILIFITVIVYYIIIPKLIIKKIRSGKDGVSYPENYDQLLSEVVVEKDKQYSSKFELNSYDIYRSNKTSNKMPFVIWMHGGFFVTGDKKGTENVCTFLASRGITVVSMNYAVAPERKHPTAILQIDELITHLQNNEPNLDYTKIVLAGDSAGGQIVCEYATLLTNKQMQIDLGIELKTKQEVIKGTILVCAPIDISLLVGVNKKIDKLLPTFGRIYYGCGKWFKNKTYKYTKIFEYITSDYPETFVTDGNHISFEKQNKLFVTKLKEKTVEVEALFFENMSVEHEYLFDMKSKQSEVALDKITSFIEKVFRL